MRIRKEPSKILLKAALPTTQFSFYSMTCGSAVKVHMPDEQEQREMLIQVVSPPLQEGPGPCYPLKQRWGTAGWRTSVLTSGPCHHHLKGCYSCLAGIYSEGLWDFGSNSCSQTWSCYLHLAGIHNILHRNLERAAWKLMQQVLNTTELTVTGNQRSFSLLFPGLPYFYPSISGTNDNPTVSMLHPCSCKSQKRNGGASMYSLSTQEFSYVPRVSLPFLVLPSVHALLFLPCKCYSLNKALPHPHRGCFRNKKRLQPFLKTTTPQHKGCHTSSPGLRNKCHLCFCWNSQEKQKVKPQHPPTQVRCSQGTKPLAQCLPSSESH